MREFRRLLALLATPLYRALGYGGCLRCGLSSRFLDWFHFTPWTESNSCFPLCEHCWRKLETPGRRLPYYERMVFGSWSDTSKWPAVRAAVLSEAGPASPTFRA
jgi:hypothetical protein